MADSNWYRGSLRLAANYGLYLASFVVVHQWHYGVLPFGKWEQYSFFWIYTWVWLFSALLSRKTIMDTSGVFGQRLFPVLISFILMLGFFSIFHLFFFAKHLSRFVFVMSASAGFMLECVMVFAAVGPGQYFRTNFGKYSLRAALSEFLILSVVFGYIIWRHTGYFIDHFHSGLSLAMLLITWLTSGFLSGQFLHSGKDVNVWRVVWRSVKQAVFFFLLLSFVTFFTSPDQAEHTVFLSGSVLYALVTITVNTIIFLNTRPRSTDIVEPRILRAPEWEDEYPEDIFSMPAEKLLPQQEIPVVYSFREKLRTIYLARYPKVFAFLDEAVTLDEVDINRSIAVRTNDLYNIDILPVHQINFFCNLLELNHIRRINEYLIAVNEKLAPGGLLIGALEPSHLRFRRFMQSMPFYLARILYFFDFLWKRVCPKLPVMKGIYFTFTKGKNRVISLAEGFGRLYYSGFEVVGFRDIDGISYFIAKKTGEPKEDKNPSYGPLFKMRRVGKDGKKILVYKLRTMHPYSEYLQKFIFEHNQLQEGGKINKDFRVTSWGKVLRKLWIDELPMLINWVKGDLKLIGVRPLSTHYLSLYTPELREKRQKVKPGLVPPFYADMPKTLDQIMASELKYLKEYEKAPFSTDFKYFWRILYNIAVKRARSK